MQLELFQLPGAHPLKPFVHSIFHVRGAAASVAETILPKGNVDILFNLGAPLAAAGARSTARLATGGVQLAGVQTASFASRPEGEMNLVGVSLHMERAYSILPIPQHEIADRRVEAIDLLPEAVDMPDLLAAEQDFDARRTMLLEWIASRVRAGERDALIAHACGALRRRPTETRIAELARDAGMSPRHFQRIFTAAVGVSPSRYVRMRRFVRALHLMQRLPTLTEVAHAAWYADHAHFCRDFKDFAGMTPDTYRRHSGPVPGHALLDAGAMSDSYKASRARFDIMPEQEALTDDRIRTSPR